MSKYSFEQLQENIYRLKQDHETDLDVIKRLINTAGKNAMMDQLEIPIDNVLVQEIIDDEQLIRDIANRLPADNLLRLAIEAIL